MSDVLTRLEGQGWHLFHVDDEPAEERDPYRLSDEAVTWTLRRGLEVVQLAFHAFGDLGGYTNAAEDIFYCELRGTPIRLYFVKRKSPEWRERLRAFADEVSKHGQDARR